MRKICVITGTRAEYGLLSWLMKQILDHPNLELQIISTGMHMSHEFGLTYKLIEKDGFEIDKKIEMVLSADTPSAISKSTGLGMISFSDAFIDLKPDIIILLGDTILVLIQGWPGARLKDALEPRRSLSAFLLLCMRRAKSLLRVAPEVQSSSEKSIMKARAG